MYTDSIENWLSSFEEIFSFDKEILDSKYEDFNLNEGVNVSSESDGDQTILTKSNDAIYRLMGIADIEQKEFYKNALNEWRNELNNIFSIQRKNSSANEGVEKRLYVLKKIYNLHTLQKLKKKVQKKTDNSLDQSDNVPVIVRLGILSLFPIIESLSGLESSRYNTLCSKIFDSLISVLSSLPALSMKNEPAECIDAYQDFISNLIKENDFKIDSDLSQKALNALITIAVSRGNLSSFLYVLDTLFNIHEKLSGKTVNLEVGTLISKLTNLNYGSSQPTFNEQYDIPFKIVELNRILTNAGKSCLNNGKMAVDGKYIYILNDCGLYKVGSGFQNTVKGLIYGRDEKYKQTYQTCSITYCNDKLYILTNINGSGNGDNTHEVLVLDTSFQELKRINLKPHPTCKKVYLISDGVKFYMIGIKTTDKSSTTSNFVSIRSRNLNRLIPPNLDSSDSSSSSQSDDDEREWEEEEYEEEEEYPEENETYDPPLRQFNLPRSNMNNVNRDSDPYRYNISKSESKAKNVEAISVDIFDNDSFENPVGSFETSIQTEQGVNEVFYCTGQHLVYFKRTHNPNATIHVYNLETKQKVDINKNLNAPYVCFDPKNNLIWAYNDEQSIVTPYIYHGPTPLQDPIETHFNPEHVIKSIGISSEKVFLSIEEILLSISANMSRFSRNHPFFHTTYIPYESIGYSSNEFFASPVNLETLNFISKVLLKALKILSNDINQINMAFIVNTILKLLKICIYEISTQETKELISFKELKDQLVDFILSPLDSDYIKIAKNSAIDTLIVGLNVFFPEKSDKLSFIQDCILNSSKSSIHKRMLNSFLYSLSRWGGTGNLISSDEDTKVQENSSDSSNKSKRKEEKNKIKNLPDDMKSILTSLIRLANTETLETLKDVKDGKTINLHITPSLKLILALQKEFIYSPTSKAFLIDYIGILIPEITSFINEIQKSFTINAKHPEYDEALRSSILNVVLLPLVSYFVNRSYSKNFELALNIIDHMITLITALDKFNEMSGLVREVNILCFYKQPNKVSKSYEWLIELENIIALVCGNISTALIEGQQPSDKENQCKLWLDTRLLNGGLDKASPETSERMKFLINFAEGSEDTKPLYTWLTTVSGNRLMLRAAAKKVIELTERHIYAAMFKHLGLIDEARSILYSLTSEPIGIISADVKGKFGFLGQKVSSLSSYLVRKGEIQKEWQIAIEDRPEDSSVFDSFQQDIHKLKELCEMKDVEFDLVEPNESVKKLFNKLQEEIKEFERKVENDSSVQLPNPYEYICEPVIQRAKFLLKMTPSNRTIHPSADRANPFSISKPFSRRSLRASTSKITPDTNIHPLSKSISQLPTTETAQAKERRRVHEEQTSRDFSQRVSALRKWIRSYNSWKNWQDSTLLEKSSQKDESPPNSPLQGVISFVQNSFITIKDLDKIIKIQNSRAKYRIEGLKYLKKLLSSCCTTTARNQILGSISKFFSKGTHYLDSIQSSGETLTIEVTKGFVSLYEFITSIIKDTSIDPTSRILALSICSVIYREQDIEILSKPSLFTILQKVMNESSPKLKSIVESDEAKKKEYNEYVMKQHDIFKQASWTALRILIIQTIGWSLDEDVIQDKASVNEILTNIFDLIFDEISRITMNLSPYSFKEQKEIDNISNEQCFQLLSLLYLLSSNLRKSIDSKNLNILLSVLRTSTSTKSQRLVLRLLKKTLSSQYEFVNEDLVNTFLNQIGKWILEGRYMAKHAVDNKLNDGKSQVVNEDNQSDMYEVHILVLPNSAKRPLEEILSEDTGGSDNLDNLLLTQKVVKEIADSGFSQLKKGDKETCEEFAKSIAELGCSVRIQKLSSDDDNATTPQNKDIQSFPHWINGHSALCLASEYISLLRSFTLPNSYHQFDILKSSLKNNVLNIPKIVEILRSEKELSKDFLRNDLNKAIASLCVLSGFHEPIRVGGKVIIKSGIVDEEATSATVIKVSHTNKVEVILNSATKDIRKLDIRYVKPTPEILIDPKKFTSFTNEVLPSLLSVLNINEELPKFNQILFNDLQLRSLHVISILLQNSECLQFALTSSLKKYIPSLFEKLKQCKPTSHFSTLRASIVELGQYLYDYQTRPSSIYSSSTRMSDILPHCPFNYAKSLPYSLIKGKSLSVIFHGDDMRTVEYIGAKPIRRNERQRGRGNALVKNNRGSNTPLEVVIFGNNVIPTLNSDYYFEMKVLKADPEAIISIGLSKEGASTWEKGSHRYQANKFKTCYPDGQRKIENYGENFSVGSIVGCGWNQAEGVIYFTKDGVDLGPAFTDVYKNNERVVPAIGIGKGVIVTVNFGQSPFAFDLSVLNDKDLKEKRRLENEERLKREEEERQNIIKAAAEPILQMGYDMKKVLKALEVTGYDDTEATVMWLLENADSIPDEPEEEEVKEEVKQEEPKPESGLDDSEKSTSDSYDITASSNYILKDIYTYYSSLDRNRKVKDTESVKELLIQEWETKSMPNLKEWMEKDGFKQYEITEYLHRITEEYKKGNEKGAREIVSKLLGGTSPPVTLPSVKSFLDTSIKIYQINVGMHLVVKSKTQHQYDWVSPQMDNTIGKVGVVKAIDIKSNRVLLEFYDSERSTIEEWWYATQSLAKTSKPVKTLDYSMEKFNESYLFCSSQLGNIYSRRIVLLFLEHTKLSNLSEINISITDSLEIAASEYLSSSIIITSPKSLISDKQSTNRMNTISQKVLDHLKELENDTDKYRNFVQDLIQKACDYIEKSKSFCKPEIVSNGTWIPSIVRDFEYDNARAVSIIFDKSTAIPQKGKIEIIADDENFEPSITYLPNEPLVPYVISTNNLFIRFSSDNKTVNRATLQLLPINAEFSLARWLSDFTFEYTLKAKPNIDILFNTILDFIYATSSPNPLKETLFNLLSRMFLSILRSGIADKNILTLESLSRLAPLKNEMIHLYSTEAPKLKSSYLQSLVEFFSIVKYYSNVVFDKDEQDTLIPDVNIVDLIHDYQTSTPPPPPLPTSHKKKVQEEQSEEEDELKAAIALSISANKKKSSIIKSLYPKTKDQDEPQWLRDVYTCFDILEVFNSRNESSKYQNQVLIDLCKSIWTKYNFDTIMKRLIILNGLPTLPSDRKIEVVSAVEEMLNDFSIQIVETSTWLPVDRENNVLKSFMVIELRNGSKVNELLDNLSKKPLKLNDNDSESYTLTATCIESISPFRSTTKLNSPATTEAADPRLREYLKDLLIDSETKELTKSYERILTEIFSAFSVDYNINGVIDRKRLCDFQLVCSGESMDENTLNEIFSENEVKEYEYFAVNPPFPGTNTEPSKSKSGTTIKTTGITLKGFLNIYKNQAIEFPVETWEELFNLGYDIHLTKLQFTNIKDSIESILNNPLFNNIHTDEELVQYVEQCFNETDLNSQLDMSSSDILPIHTDAHISLQYPKLAKLSLPALRLRFELIKLFNTKLTTLLPLIDLNGDGIISQRLSQCRGLIFHSVKMQFFYDVLDKTSVQIEQPTVTIDRLQLAAKNEAASDDKLENNSNENYYLKNTAFGIAFEQLRHIDPLSMRQKKPVGAEPHFSIKIDFKGENVEGEGGPYRQFFTDVSRELTKVLPLLIPCPNAQTKVGKNRDKYIVAPSCKSTLHLRMYKFLGNLMGVAIRTGVILNVDFPSFFWKPLTGQRISLEDLKDIDHSFYGFMKYMELCKRSDLEGDTKCIFEKFKVTLSDKSTVLLKPNGDNIDVTYNNREEYISLAIKARINEHYIQMKHILQGLTEIIPRPLLKLCTWQDLEWRVCGKPYIDINLLKRHTQYAIVSSQAPHIKYFWQVLRSFSQEDRRAFIRFAWAQERLPTDDQEFIRTQTRMLIKPFEGLSDPDSSFPKADTCFFNLMLPQYSSPQILREKLLFAIHTDADSMDADEPNQNDEDEIGNFNYF